MSKHGSMIKKASGRLKHGNTPQLDKDACYIVHKMRTEDRRLWKGLFIELAAKYDHDKLILKRKVFNKMKQLNIL